MFDTVFFRIDQTAWVKLNIPGVGVVDHHFDVPPELHKALLDYAKAQGEVRVAEIQANMTARTFVANTNGTEDRHPNE